MAKQNTIDIQKQIEITAETFARIIIQQAISKNINNNQKVAEQK